MEPSITMTGNLVADPVRRVTAAGVVITKLRIASNHRRFDRERGEWISSDPVYLDVNCWRQLGDNVAASLKKGDSVLVSGRLTMREYDDANGGARRQSYAIDADFATRARNRSYLLVRLQKHRLTHEARGTISAAPFL